MTDRVTAVLRLPCHGAWNDATGFFVTPRTNPKASLTSAGCSHDAGNAFTDLTGLRNHPADSAPDRLLTGMFPCAYFMWSDGRMGVPQDLSRLNPYPLREVPL